MDAFPVNFNEKFIVDRFGAHIEQTSPDPQRRARLSAVRQAIWLKFEEQNGLMPFNVELEKDVLLTEYDVMVLNNELYFRNLKIIYGDYVQPENSRHARLTVTPAVIPQLLPSWR